MNMTMTRVSPTVDARVRASVGTGGNSDAYMPFGRIGHDTGPSVLHLHRDFGNRRRACRGERRSRVGPLVHRLGAGRLREAFSPRASGAIAARANTGTLRGKPPTKPTPNRSSGLSLTSNAAPGRLRKAHAHNANIPNRHSPIVAYVPHDVGGRNASGGVLFVHGQDFYRDGLGAIAVDQGNHDAHAEQAWAGFGFFWHFAQSRSFAA